MFEVPSFLLKSLFIYLFKVGKIQLLLEKKGSFKKLHTSTLAKRGKKEEAKSLWSYQISYFVHF